MIVFRNGLVALAVMLFWASMPASAETAEDLRQYVERNTQQLVNKLNAEKGLYE